MLDWRLICVTRQAFLEGEGRDLGLLAHPYTPRIVALISGTSGGLCGLAGQASVVTSGNPGPGLLGRTGEASSLRRWGPAHLLGFLATQRGRLGHHSCLGMVTQLAGELWCTLRRAMVGDG